MSARKTMSAPAGWCSALLQELGIRNESEWREWCRYGHPDKAVVTKLRAQRERRWSPLRAAWFAACGAVAASKL